QLERDPGTAKIGRPRVIIQPLRIDHRVRRGQLRTGQVMIGHDDVDLRVLGSGHGVDGRDAAVAGNYEFRAYGLSLRQSGRTELVAVAQTMRDESRRVAAGEPERPGKQGRRTLTVYVEVTVD